MSDTKDTTTDAMTHHDKNEEKYALRPRSAIKRQKQDQYQPDYIPKRPPRRLKKPKSTPLSKYRRKTANARERHRMKVINTAFETLRKVLPEGMDFCTSSSTMTKISTLRLAVNYIRNLSKMLEGEDDEGTTKMTPEGGGHHLVLDQKKERICSPSSVEISGGNSGVFQVVPQITNKNLLRCTRPSSLEYVQPSSYYLNSNQPHLTSSKNYAFSSSSTSSSARGSLSSTSDLEELLSDDSELLEDNFDVFNDIPSMTTSNDPFEVLLEAEKNCQPFATA